jgi:hypothetical protein
MSRTVRRYEFARLKHRDQAFDAVVEAGLVAEAPGGTGSCVIDVYFEGGRWAATKGWSPISRGHGAWRALDYGRHTPTFFPDVVRRHTDQKP